MNRAANRTYNMAAAQRGVIVQRVLVDGWSPAAVAASYHLDERQVTALVAAYRRRGMAALRGEALPQGAVRYARILCDALVRVFWPLRRRVRTGIGAPESSRSIELGRRDADARYLK